MQIAVLARHSCWLTVVFHLTIMFQTKLCFLEPKLHFVVQADPGAAGSPERAARGAMLRDALQRRAAIDGAGLCHLTMPLATCPGVAAGGVQRSFLLCSCPIEISSGALAVSAFPV